jgi:capsular polysaccharide biosynthesis protein
MMHFVMAALHDGEPGGLVAAVVAAVTAEIPPMLRVRLAWRLAAADRPAEAWTVLHSDPATLWEPAGHAAIVQMLARITQSAGAEPALRAAAAALGRRFGNLADLEPVPAPYRFADGPLDPLPGPGAARIRPARGVTPPLLGAYEAAIADREATLASRVQPVVHQVDDVFVNRLGHVWTPAGKMLLQHQTQPLPQASRAAMREAPVVAEALLAVETHHNVFHWLADWLPSIAWRFEPGAPALPVVIRDDAAPYVTETLRLAGGATLGIVPAGDALRVRRLFRSTPAAAAIAPIGAHRRLLEALRAGVDVAPAPPGGPARRLYISRRDTTRRRLDNEDAVEASLAARGFRCVTFTGVPYAAQARLVRDAAVIVAPHGAGLAHLLLARPGTAVFEMVPGTEAGATLTTCMTWLSRLAGLRHLVWLEAQNPLTGRWGVDLPAMLAELDAFLADG